MRYHAVAAIVIHDCTLGDDVLFSHSMFDGSLKSKSAKAAGRASVSRRNSFSIASARAGLRRALIGARQHELEGFRHLCDAGFIWIDICAWLDDPSQHGGKRLSAQTWAKENKFYSKRWLDEHAAFARAWPKFVDAWKWASAKGYSPDRRPSLRSAQNLMELKRRDDGFQIASARRRTLVRVKPAAQLIVPLPEKLIINPNQTMLVGDVVEMARKHIPDESFDLLIADPPFNLTIPETPNFIDRYKEEHNMRPRFREEWDNFPNVEAYYEFTKPWLLEAVRCLHEKGSMFIFCSDHSIGTIMWLLQTEKINFVHIIPVFQFNQDPVVTKRTLQYSKYFVVWVTKSPIHYRFHYDAAKWDTGRATSSTTCMAS
jgi:hypothetical protein